MPEDQRALFTRGAIDGYRGLIPQLSEMLPNEGGREIQSF